MAKNFAGPQWQLSLITLTATVVGVVIVATLYWAQVVFIPVGLALFLVFILTPLVRALQRRGVPRVPAVLLVVVGTVALVVGSLLIVGRQLASLAEEMPTYSTNIRQKVKSVRALSSGSDRLAKMVNEVESEFSNTPAVPKDSRPEGTTPDKPPEVVEKPTAVILQPRTPAWLERVPAYVGAALESLGTLALALVLLIFMLLNREDLRDRFLRLVGNGRLTATTKAVDDAGQRISQYLLMQAVVNGTFGLALSLGLYLIGVKYAILWGFLAAILRYVPYLGAWIAAAFPILLSLAMFNSWWQPLAVVGLVLTLELFSNNVIEPWLYGQSMGVSTVAQLVSAAFWSFLWGPIGLVLSAPLTVVLLVLGKHVPQLQFLDVILGDEPVLEPDVSYYQRLLARDQDDASELVLAATKNSNTEQVFDDLLVAALTFAKRDYEKDALSDADRQFILETTQVLIDDLGESRLDEKAKDAQPGEPITDNGVDRVRILACPAHDEADRLALLMLKQIVDDGKWEMEVGAVETLSAELLTQLAEDGRYVVCIGSLPPGGLAQTRYLCKRLRARFPHVKILVGRWGLRGNVESNREQLQQAGADLVATTLRETRQQLESLFTILPRKKVTPAAADAVGAAIGQSVDHV